MARARLLLAGLPFLIGLGESPLTLLRVEVQRRVPEATASPALAAVLAPAEVQCGVWTVPAAVDSLADRFAADPRSTTADADRAGTGAVIRMLPLELIDSAAPVDRQRVARLYGGDRVRALRAPLSPDGRAVGTLVAFGPYPAPDLQTLVDGTVIIACTGRRES